MEMVKIEREIREWYETYVRTFHKDDVLYMENINLKYDHTERVVIETRGIALSLGVSHHDLTLLLISALLHDLGRYEQLKRFGTFNDKKSLNHANLALEIIEEFGVLDRLSEYDKYVVCTTIKNHNRLSVPKNLSEKEVMFCNVIRDADKLDILRILSVHYNEIDPQNPLLEIGVEGEDLTVKTKVIEALQKREVISYSDITTVTELKLLQIGWVYDINFPWTFQLLENRNFIEAIVSTIDATSKLEKYLTLAVGYLKDQALLAKESGLRAR